MIIQILYCWSMTISTRIRTGRHCVFNMHIHLVFVTKYRRAVFKKAILNEMKMIFTLICERFEAELIEFEGERDHVHLLVNYPPKLFSSSYCMGVIEFTV